MPIPAGEIALSARGLARLLRFDGGFVACFDASRAGARRSLRLGWLLAPVGLLSLLIDLEAPPGLAAIGTWPLLSAAAVYYAIAWALPPLVFLLLAPTLDREAEMPGFVTVYNWLSAALLLPFCLLSVLASLGLRDLAEPAQVVLFYGSFILEAFAARRLLRFSLLGAAAFALLDFLLGRLTATAFFVMAFQ